ncbi:DNA-directed RNA polymerase subunit omega [Evtepia sp.]|uniref:DNA-directed RNA polymerase subunit omega n=1 Tax=Evtepia sp. TaxID=2773933 RepID=UPI003F1520CF
MLLYPAMNELLAQVPSRYKLVNVVAARARQIANEAEEQGLMLEDKTVSIAVREIAEGKLPQEAVAEEVLLEEEEEFLPEAE